MINGIRVGRIRMFPLLQIQFTTQSVPYDPVSVRSMRRKSNQSQGLESSIVIGLFSTSNSNNVVLTRSAAQL